MDFDPDFYKKLSRARQLLLRRKLKFQTWNADKCIEIKSDDFIDPGVELDLYYAPYTPREVCGIMCDNSCFDLLSLRLGDPREEVFLTKMSGISLSYRKLTTRIIFPSFGIAIKIKNISGIKSKPKYTFLIGRILNEYGILI